MRVEAFPGAAVVELALDGVAGGEVEGDGFRLPCDASAGADLVVGDDGAGEFLGGDGAIVGLISTAYQLGASIEFQAIGSFVNEAGIGQVATEVPLVIDVPENAPNGEDGVAGEGGDGDATHEVEFVTTEHGDDCRDIGGGVEGAGIDLLLEINTGTRLDEDGGFAIDEVLEGDDAGSTLKGIGEPGFVVDTEVEALVIRANPEEPLAAGLIGPGGEVDGDALVEFEVVVLDLEVAAATLHILMEAEVSGSDNGGKRRLGALDDRGRLAGGGGGFRAGKCGDGKCGKKEQG